MSFQNKFGIGFFIISFLIIGQASFGEYISCSPNWSGMCGFATGIYNIPMIAITGGLVESIPSKLLGIFIIVLLSSIFWAFIGGIIGRIIDKVKSNTPFL